MSDPSRKSYLVLARKYRPQNFDALVGQEALVRTLRNAIDSGRIAHAYILTGVRGVGKTTTARIIARALNYTGPDGKSGPTTGPTDDCAVCRAIAEDRHPDVLEMDAASRTGVDDIRELIEGVRYAPTSARYKVYIIDEVHMLSKAAFNALLKTLEEPPPHVIFIFATTEIRKVPVTVLSRCQRFDLRRIEADVLAAYYKKICGLESVAAQDEALALIARAADGSARDGLSMLDQAIVLGDGAVETDRVREMLGLSDRLRGLDLLEAILRGDAPGALGILQGFFHAGADPSVVMEDLLDFVHRATRLRAVPDSAADLEKTAGTEEMDRLRALARSVGMPALVRTWQILLKGLAEVGAAPAPRAAAEMVVIRLIHAADLPDPATLLKTLSKAADATGTAAPRPRIDTHPGATGGYGAEGSAALAMPLPQAEPIPLSDRPPASGETINTLHDVVRALERAGAYVLAGQVRHFVHLVRLAPGQIEIRPAPDAPARLSQDLGKTLGEATGQRWIVSVCAAPGLPTLDEEDARAQAERDAQVRSHPLVLKVLDLFPGARVVRVHPPEDHSSPNDDPPPTERT
jgi:DNA polymerase-3 subunit gamma/tau